MSVSYYSHTDDAVLRRDSRTMQILQASSDESATADQPAADKDRAGSILNRNPDGIEAFIDNNFTSIFLTVSLIGCIASFASTLAAHHLWLWCTETLAVAAVAATSLIDWLLTLLAMSLACKEIHTGGNRTRRLKTLEALLESMAFGIDRAVNARLVVINFIRYFLSPCLFGFMLNHDLDGGSSGKSLTSVFFLLALIAKVVGFALTLACAHHLRLWRTETLAAAAATAVIAWLLNLLAVGVACKEIHTGGNCSKRLKAFEAFKIILNLLYFPATYARAYAYSVTREGYANTPAVKNPHHGTPAATVV